MSTSSSIVPSSVAGERSGSSASGVAFRIETLAELRQQLRDKQAEVDALKGANLKLTNDLTELRMDICNSKKLKVLAESRSDLSAEQALSAVITKLGKYHSAFYRPSISPEYFGKPKPPFKADDVARYQSDEHVKLGHIAELYECIPPPYHMVIQDDMPTAVTLFTKAISDARSTALFALRKSAATIFTTVDPKYLGTKCTIEKPLSTSPEIQKLLGIERIPNPDVPGSFLTRSLTSNLDVFPPVLYKDFDASNIAGLFRNEWLFTIAKVVLGQANGLRGSNTYNHVDKRENRTTDGFIAWVAIATIYTLSDDIEFSSTGVGQITKRPYLNRFDFFKRYLLQHCATRKSLLRTWDRHVFPTSHVHSASDTALTPCATIVSTDPYASLLADFARQSTISSGSNHDLTDSEDDDTEDFNPPAHSSGALDINYDDIYDSPIRPNPELPDVGGSTEFHSPHAASFTQTAPLAPTASTTPSDAISPDAAPGHVTPGDYQRSLSASETRPPALLNPAEPGPAPKKKANRTKKASPVNPDATIVPAQPRTGTRASTRIRK